MNDKSIFRFVGDTPDYGLLYFCVHQSPGKVWLWSFPLPDDHPDAKTIGGYSWTGSINEFRKQFTQVKK